MDCSQCTNRSTWPINLSLVLTIIMHCTYHTMSWTVVWPAAGGDQEACAPPFKFHCWQSRVKPKVFDNNLNKMQCLGTRKKEVLRFRPFGRHEGEVSKILVISRCWWFERCHIWDWSGTKVDLSSILCDIILVYSVRVRHDYLKDITNLNHNNNSIVQ